jgi:hypothetical protein
MEPLIRTQRHDPTLAVVFNRVAFEHLRLRVHLRVAPEQDVEHLETDVARGHRAGPNGIEAGQGRLRDESQGRRGSAQCRRGKSCRCAEHEAAPFHGGHCCSCFFERPLPDHQRGNC